MYHCAMKQAILLLLIVATSTSYSQDFSQETLSEVVSDSISGLEGPIDFQKRKRIFWATGIGGYSAMATGLYFAWYNQFDQEAFHTFDDWNEWRNVDKAGHVYSAYFQAQLINDAALWAGYSEEKALVISSLASLWGQLNIEIMDGFSSEWGFSAGDVAGNLLGTGLFYAQQKIWKEQRIKVKMSFWPVSYPVQTLDSESGLAQSSLQGRSEELYGTGLERFLKDYNGQTIWLSANPSMFFPDTKLPKWLSVAVGYSAHNLFGGFENSWELDDERFVLDQDLFPRSSQFILALDYDLRKVKHSTAFGTALFKLLDIFKFPAPAVSYDTARGWQLHFLYLN